MEHFRLLIRYRIKINIGKILTETFTLRGLSTQHKPINVITEYTPRDTDKNNLIEMYRFSMKNKYYHHEIVKENYSLE